MTKYNKLTKGKIKRFLREMEKHGNLKASSAAIGVTPQTIYQAKKRIPGFAERIDMARNKAGGEIEKEMRRRGIEGVDKPVYYQGEVVGYEKQYSDQLLMMLAKGAHPETYGKLDARFQIEHKHSVDDGSIDKLASLLNISLPKNEDVIEGEFEEQNLIED